MVEEWEAIWDRKLAIDLNAQVPKRDTNTSSESPDENCYNAAGPPTWLVPLNDLFIEWVYIVDLDREIFSVNNSTHFKLDQVSKIDWIGALVGFGRDAIALPARLPEGVLTNLVADPRTAHPIELSVLQSPRKVQVGPRCIAG